VLIGFLTTKIRAFTSIILGTLISAIGWLTLIVFPKTAMFFHVGSSEIWGVAVVALVVLAFGEIIQSPRYYEYISRLAPPGQQGTYMGFAFLPIGIGSLLGGRFAGALIHHFGEVKHKPDQIWVVVSGIGLLTAVSLWIYDRTIRPKPQQEQQAQAAS
jgi:dipeptide/tripeptide permease